MMRWRPFAAWLLSALAVGACLSTRVTGAGTIDDLRAEDQYKQVYAQHMAIFQVDVQPLVATGSSPGVCNKGGTKQGCFDADARLIADLQAMLSALEATPVPPRYTSADKLLREAIATDIRGLDLRNRAIATNDDALWQQHGPVLDEATAAFQTAYQAFPVDNRPQPPP